MEEKELASSLRCSEDNRQAAAREILTKSVSPAAGAQRCQAITTLFNFQNLAGQGPSNLIELQSCPALSSWLN